MTDFLFLQPLETKCNPRNQIEIVTPSRFKLMLISGYVSLYGQSLMVYINGLQSIQSPAMCLPFANLRTVLSFPPLSL